MDDFNDYTDEPSEERYGPLFPSDFEGLEDFSSLSGDDHVPMMDTDDFDEEPLVSSHSPDYDPLEDTDSWDFYDSETPSESSGDHFYAADNYAGDDPPWEPPPVLDMDTPQPVDGFPWSDVDTIDSNEPVAFNVESHLENASPTDLGYESFAQAQGDSDPTIAALARWWGA